MSKYLGDYDASTIIYDKFTSYRPTTGAPFTLAGTPALSVYKDNSLTESTTGVTLTADFDARTGLNHYTIDTSADGTFYAAGSFFEIVITAGTVDSVSVVGAVVASFTIRKDSSLKPATAGRTLVVDAAGLADANAVKLGPTGSGTAQTARDVGATLGVAGAGLTALGDTRIANLDATVSSRTKPADTQAAVTTVTNLTNAPTAGDFTATMKTSITTAATAATPSVTVSDKTGFSLSTAGILAIWHQLTSAIVTAGSIGKLLVDDIDAAISTRTKPADTQAAVTTVTNLTNAPTAGDFTATMKTSLNAATPAVTVSDKTGFSLTTPYDPAKTAAQAGDAMTLTTGERTAIWAVTGRTLTSFGTLVADTAAAVWAAISRTLTDKTGFSLTSAYDAAKTAGDATASNQGTIISGLVAINSDTDDIQTRLPAVLVAGRMDSSVGAYQAGQTPAKVADLPAAPDNTGIAAIKAKTDNLPASPAAVSDIPTSDANAVALLDKSLSGHTTAGTTGEAISAAGSAGDPWTSALPGAYGPGTAGKIVGDNLDAKVSLVKAKTDNLPASPAATGAQMDLISVPNAVAVTAIQSGLATDAHVLAVKAKTDNLPASPAATGAQMDLVNAPNVTAVAAIQSSLATDAHVLAVKAKTDNLPGSPAATGARMDLIDAPNATAVAAIQSGLGTSSGQTAISAAVASVQADTDDIQTRLPAALNAGRMDSSVGAYQAGETPAKVADLPAVPTTDEIVLAILQRKITRDSLTGEFIIWNAAGDAETGRLTPTLDATALPVIGMEPTP